MAGGSTRQQLDEWTWVHWMTLLLRWQMCGFGSRLLAYNASMITARIESLERMQGMPEEVAKLPPIQSLGDLYPWTRRAISSQQQGKDAWVDLAVAKE